MKPRTVLLTRALAGLALALAACRSGIDEARFDDFDARLVETIEQAHGQKEDWALEAPGDERDRRLSAWDDVLGALLLARAAGALAYLSDDEQSLADIERKIASLVALMPAPPRSAGSRALEAGGR